VTVSLAEHAGQPGPALQSIVVTALRRALT
jgi:hypothetical protein